MSHNELWDAKGHVKKPMGKESSFPRWTNKGLNPSDISYESKETPKARVHSLPMLCDGA